MTSGHDQYLSGGSKYKWLVETDGPVQGTDKVPSLSAAWRNKLTESQGFPPSLENVTTCYELFQRSARLYGSRRCLGWRRREEPGAQLGPYDFMTFQEASDVISSAAAGLHSFKLKKGSRVAVFGGNSPEWMLAMQACNRQGYCCVPVYDTLGEQAVAHALVHSECEVMVVSDAKMPAVKKALAQLPKTAVLRAVITWSAVGAKQDAASVSSDSSTMKTKDGTIEALSWESLLKRGSGSPVSPDPPQASDPSTIMYTSGTTGDPKGVVLSHRAVVSTVASLASYIEDLGLQLGDEQHSDVMLSYLPLAHVFDRVVEELMLGCGGAVGYSCGDPRKLTEDLAALRPTLMIGVPRVFERIQSQVKAKLHHSSWMTNMVYNLAYNAKLLVAKNRTLWGPIGEGVGQGADWLVFSNVQKQLGGCVRFICSGGAPLSEKTEEFMRVALNCPVLQGYGLTETCAASFLQRPFDWSEIGTAGPVQSACEFRLQSVPEMGHDALADPPAGEVLIRGPQLFSGYYNAKRETDATMTADGWFMTGDIATLAEDGSLRIIDRKKNLFKLAHGEYISPERIESMYREVAVVGQVWVTGTSTESSLVAVVVPHPKVLRGLASASSLSAANTDAGLKDVCNNAAVKKEVLDALVAAGKTSGLKGFEQIRALRLDMEEWSIENALMTPSLKLKRQALKAKYEKEVAAMYRELEAQL